MTDITTVVFPVATTNQAKLNSTLGTSVSHQSHRHSCVTFNFVFYTVFGGTFCILGLIGNTVSIIVLRYDRRNLVAALLLQALAFADNCLLLLTFPALSILNGLLPYINRREVSDAVWPYYFKYGNPIAYMTLTQTILMTCLLALNRYIAVCKVFHASKLCTLRKVRIQIAVITTFSVLFNFPRFFQYVIVKNNTGAPFRAIPTSIGAGSLFEIIYATALFTVLVFLLPLILLVVLNTKLILAIKEAYKDRRRLNNTLHQHRNSAAEDNITKVMVIIILVFILCHAPDRIYLVLKKCLPKKKCGDALFYYHALCNLLVVINSSANFVIYCVFRNRFKKVVMRIFCGWASERYKYMFSAAEPTEHRKFSLLHHHNHGNRGARGPLLHDHNTARTMTHV